MSVGKIVILVLLLLGGWAAIVGPISLRGQMPFAAAWASWMMGVGELGMIASSVLGIYWTIRS